MNDLISRQAALDALKNSRFPGAPYVNAGISIAIGVICDLPFARTEIIRCKDCKWFNELGCAIRIIDESDKPKETDFCSFGERKDGDT